MSIFLAFSLQKRLEHILNSMPGYSPRSAPKDPLARRHIADGIGGNVLGLRALAPPFPLAWASITRSKLCPFRGLMLSGVPGWRMEGLCAAHPLSGELCKGLGVPSVWSLNGHSHGHSRDPAQQGPQQGPQDTAHRIAKYRPDKQTGNTLKPLLVVVKEDPTLSHPYLLFMGKQAAPE